MPSTMSALSTPELSPSSASSPATLALGTPADEVPSFNLGAPARTSGKARLPNYWAHRGISGTFPENTMASFIEACRKGADGIETDLHITSDNQVLLFHDSELDGKTDGHGRIGEQPWHGVLEHVRTKQSPAQPIPLLGQVLDLMLWPGNEQLKLNLDCKVENDPNKLFKLVQEALTRMEQWEQRLAPRVILGLWHPKFLAPAVAYLPFLPRCVISMSLSDARRYFWTSVHSFSMWFDVLATPDGQRFLDECRRAGKGVCAWTVNTKEAMRDCARWELETCMSDEPEMWREVQEEFRGDNPPFWAYTLPVLTKGKLLKMEQEAYEYMAVLEAEGGKFADWAVEVGLEIKAA